MADYWGRSAGWCARSTNRRQCHSLAAYRPHPQASSAFDPRRLLHRLEDVGAGWCPIVGGEDSGDRGAALRHPDRSRSAVRPRPPTRDWSRPRWAPHCVRVPIARQLNPTLKERPQQQGLGVLGLFDVRARGDWSTRGCGLSAGLARSPSGHFASAAAAAWSWTAEGFVRRWSWLVVARCHAPDG